MTGLPQTKTLNNFLTLLLQDNWPEMDATLLDLSPFYLEEARKNMATWKRLRSPNLSFPGTEAGAGVRYLQAPAESIPQPDESFDAVSVRVFQGFSRVW